MSYQHALINLLPPVAYDSNADSVRTEMQIDAAELDRVARSADNVTDALDPRTAAQYLLDWERVFDLPRHGTYQRRVSAVLAAINATGGLLRQYFIALAAANNFEITIDEPQPFRAGVSQAGEHVWDESVMWLWIVNVLNHTPDVTYFRTGSSGVGDALAVYEQFGIAELFNKLKPAHTQCVIKYRS